MTFVDEYSLTFINLWDGSSKVWEHYGKPGTSRSQILDRGGSRVGEFGYIYYKSLDPQMIHDYIQSENSG